jgi:lipopolysaccharide exporter
MNLTSSSPRPIRCPPFILNNAYPVHAPALKDLDRKIAVGAAWMVGFKLIDRSIGLLSTIVLARVLAPEDFGLVAMAMVLIGALELVISFSFDVVLIQNPQAGRAQFDTAWTFNLLFAGACALVLAVLAPHAARLYGEERLETIIYLLAGGFALQGTANIGPVLFRRDMRFDQEFKFLLGKRLSTFLITIPAALYFRNYWALIIGQLAATALSVALSYVMSSYRPRLSFSARLELFHKSKWLVLNNLFQFLNNSAAQFVIGRIAGAPALGVYAIASEIATLPTTELVAPINRAAFPGYAKAAGDLVQLRASFLKVIASIALFALPAGIGIVLVADLLVPAVLGWKWLAAIPLIQVLAVYGVIQALQTNISYVYLALGRLPLVAAIGALQFLILAALMVPALTRYGVAGAAWAFLGTMLLMIPVNQVLIARCLALGPAGVAACLLRPAMAALAMAAGVWLLKQGLTLRPLTSDYVLALLLCAGAGALLYALALYALWRGAGRPDGAERFAFEKLQALLARAGLRIDLVGAPRG